MNSNHHRASFLLDTTTVASSGDDEDEDEEQKRIAAAAMRGRAGRRQSIAVSVSHRFILFKMVLLIISCIFVVVENT